MKSLIRFLCAVLLGLAASGCIGPADSTRLVVRGDVSSDPEVYLLPFHPPYRDVRLPIKVSSPKELKASVLYLSFESGWGSKASIYGDSKRWEGVRGPIQFEVRPHDIGLSHDGHRQIRVDRIRVSKWPNQSLEPTATAVTPPAAQEIVPAAAVAHQ